MARPLKLLFVCSGNICRSPMAEALSEAIGDELGITVRARSAGTLGIRESAAAPKAIAVCKEVGVDISAHRSQGITHELISWADWVLVMELAHASHLREYYPEVGERMLPLGNFAGTAEIPDPIGGWKWTFRRVRKQLERALRAVLPRLASR